MSQHIDLTSCLDEVFFDVPVLSLQRCSVEKTGVGFSAHLSPEDLREVAIRLLEKDFFLEDISMQEFVEGYAGVYHFDHFETPGRVALWVLTSKDVAELPTISDIFQGASWHERECRDFFGVLFNGHDNMSPLLLCAEDENFFPLRKNAKSVKPFADVVEQGEMIHQSPAFTLYSQSEDEKKAEDEQTSSQ
jgi:NADH-quinone oxidoreductase subunit C